MVVDQDTSPKLSASETKVIESIVGSFLYYGRAVDQIILTALNEVGMQQSKSTRQKKQKAMRLVDYLSTCSNTVSR